MSRPPIPPPPSVAEIVELVRVIAAEAPTVLPALLWCVIRSSRAVEDLRKLSVSGAHLAMLGSYPVGERLISSSMAGTKWLRRWLKTTKALDALLPLDGGLPPMDRGDDDEGQT